MTIDRSIGQVQRFLWVKSAAAVAVMVGAASGGALSASPVTDRTNPGKSRGARDAMPQEVPPLSAAATRKAAAILRDQLPCLGCHAWEGSGGRIAPDLATVRTRRSAAYVAAIIEAPSRVVPAAAMPLTRMPTATRQLIVQYLQTRAGGAVGDVPPAAAVTAPSVNAPSDGPALYGKWCAACHGTRGQGDGPNASALPIKPAAHSDARTMSLRPDDSLYDTIASGGAIMNRSPRMPAFGASLSPTEIRALVAHIRSLCRCQGPAWSRDDASNR